MDWKHEPPAWARRVPRAKIRKLYENDALGIYDEELIDEVGFALLARCQSFLDATEAAEGRAPCPHCRTAIAHQWGTDEVLHCPGCGWELTWGEYFATIQNKQLSGAEPVRELFREYIAAFPAVRTPQEKVFQIDRLIHGFHYYFKDHSPTRPVAVNLIEGKLNEVIDFLDRLSRGSTPEMQANREAWERNMEANARRWFRKKD